MSASGNSKGMGISIAAISIALIAIAIASSSLTSTAPQIEDESYVPQTKETWLFTQVDEHIDEEKFAIPPDQFSLDSIVANKGDTIKIHFYNLEPVETEEHHTFTINSPYAVNSDVGPSEESTIEFIATESGIFDYICTYHQPTMRGQLIILDN